jgi:hypothetical protein
MMRSPKHLRERARDCLSLSKSARCAVDKSVLEDIAAEMDAAAAMIEGEKYCSRVM